MTSRAQLIIFLQLGVLEGAGRLATLSFAVFALSRVHVNLYWTATRHIAVAAAMA